MNVQCVSRGRGRSRFKLVNAVRDAHWDLRAAAGRGRAAEVFVSPCNMGRARRAQAHILFVYDVMVFESPEMFDPWFGRYARTLIPYSMRRADLVLTLSEHARRGLLVLVPEANVRLLPLPGRMEALPGTPWPGLDKAVLLVAATEPHKNQQAAIHAVAKLRAEADSRVRLRVIGSVGRAEAEVLSTIRSVDPHGEWISREIGLSDAEVDEAYGSAWVLVQPSLNEGYGLPLVEAAQRGLPVVHSGAGGMSEVLPDSAAGPSSAELHGALLSLLDEQSWLSAAETNRSAAPRFSWAAFVARVEEALATLPER